MNLDKLIELYQEERGYEKHLFGDYKQAEELNFGSFLIFIKEYLEKALNAYTVKWETELPPWLSNCREFEQNNTAPVKAYEEVIKIMALAGAALETYTDINPKKWREDLEEHISKWKD